MNYMLIEEHSQTFNEGCSCHTVSFIINAFEKSANFPFKHNAASALATLVISDLKKRHQRVLDRTIESRPPNDCLSKPYKAIS